MPDSNRRRTEIVIAGGGLAGIAAAYELLDLGRRVLLIDKDTREKFGGLAKESFGGVHMIGTPHQRRLGIKDSPDLAWRDWQSMADYEPADRWPQAWGKFYCENSIEYIYEFLHHKKIAFLPLVNWAERGIHASGNTVPRWHIVWGTGYEIIHRLLNALEAHPNRRNLEMLFSTEVFAIEIANGRATGVRCTSGASEIYVDAEHTIIASGGICGGDLSKVRANWYKPWGDPPETLLNGAHIYADGLLHDCVAELGGAVTHLDLHWHYAAGVHHPAQRRPDDGLSLVPPRSALWLNARGERIMNPGPMLAYSDARHLVASVLQQPGKYSWQVMNWKIAIRELAVSGCDYMTAFRFKKKLALAKSVLFGNKELVNRLIHDCPDDIVVADTLDQLMEKMDQKNFYGLHIDRDRMAAAIRAWDDMIDRGVAFHNDEQLRRIANSRAYRGDRVRTCNFQKILEPKAGPLIAIREFILARKSLGGIQTDLECRVLRSSDGEPIPGLYAIGEAAGFGGGGAHGKGSLEGTFLGGCILTARRVAQFS
jgi:predicted oxidoreductase